MCIPTSEGALGSGSDRAEVLECKDPKPRLAAATSTSATTATVACCPSLHCLACPHRLTQPAKESYSSDMMIYQGEIRPSWVTATGDMMIYEGGYLCLSWIAATSYMMIYRAETSQNWVAAATSWALRPAGSRQPDVGRQPTARFWPAGWPPMAG